MHIYYKIPSNNQCAICHNEMNVEDKILPSSLDIFTCETCHTLYTSQNFEELIPTNIENKKFSWAYLKIIGFYPNYIVTLKNMDIKASYRQRI